MRRYRFSYFIGQAFKGLWRNGMMTLASVAVLLSCLIVMGCFSMLVMNIDRNLDALGDLNEIAAFVDSKHTYTPGSRATLASAVKAKDNKTFLGWALDPDAEEPLFMAGGQYDIDPKDAVCGDITLYAIWEGGSPTENYTVSFHASGITLNGELPEQKVVAQTGEYITLPDALTARYSTIEFLGWSLSPDPEAQVLAPGSEYVLLKNDVKGGGVTFYAIWSEMPAYATYTLHYNANRVEVKELPTDATVQLDLIHSQIRSLRNVEKIDFISKEETLEAEKEKLKDYPGLLATIQDGNNPYPDTFIITYTDNDAVAVLELELQNIAGIYKVSCRSDIAESIQSLKNGIILVFTWFMAILFAVSIFVIINTVKLAVVYRSKEITIMRYVGATKWFVALPFELEGIVIGLFSGGLSFLAQWYAYGYVQKMMTSELQMIEIVPFADIRILLLIGCLVVGVVTGLIGSGIAIRKYLKA